MRTVLSKNNISIRLTEERWFHIVENHDDLAGQADTILEIVAQHDILIHGNKDEFLAVKKINKKWLIVIYKELNRKDGFIITAFTTIRIQYFMKKEIIWIKQ